MRISLARRDPDVTERNVYLHRAEDWTGLAVTLWIETWTISTQITRREAFERSKRDLARVRTRVHLFWRGPVFQSSKFLCSVIEFPSPSPTKPPLLIPASGYLPAGSTEEQHAPSKLLSPRHSKELKIPARPRVEEVDDREGWWLGERRNGTRKRTRIKRSI